MYLVSSVFLEDGSKNDSGFRNNIYLIAVNARSAICFLIFIMPSSTPLLVNFLSSNRWPFVILILLSKAKMEEGIIKTSEAVWFVRINFLRLII